MEKQIYDAAGIERIGILSQSLHVDFSRFYAAFFSQEIARAVARHKGYSLRGSRRRCRAAFIVRKTRREYKMESRKNVLCSFSFHVAQIPEEVDDPRPETAKRRPARARGSATSASITMSARERRILSSSSSYGCAARSRRNRSPWWRGPRASCGAACRPSRGRNTWTSPTRRRNDGRNADDEESIQPRARGKCPRGRRQSADRI